MWWMAADCPHKCIEFRFHTEAQNNKALVAVLISLNTKSILCDFQRSAERVHPKINTLLLPYVEIQNQFTIINKTNIGPKLVTAIKKNNNNN